MWQRLRNHLRSERGFTLVELLVTIPAALIVAGAAIGVSGIFINNEKVISDRDDAIATAQVALDRLTRDVRQASAITAPAAGSSGSALQLTTIVGAASGSHSSSTVYWSCGAAVNSLATCDRRVGSATASPTTSFVISTANGGTTSIFTVANFASAPGGSSTTDLSAVQTSTYVSVAAQVPVRRSGATPTTSMTAGASTLNT